MPPDRFLPDSVVLSADAHWRPESSGSPCRKIPAVGESRPQRRAEVRKQGDPAGRPAGPGAAAMSKRPLPPDAGRSPWGLFRCEESTDEEGQVRFGARVFRARVR